MATFFAVIHEANIGQNRDILVTLKRLDFVV